MTTGDTDNLPNGGYLLTMTTQQDGCEESFAKTATRVSDTCETALPFSNPQFITSASGATKQVKKARFDMVPADVLRELAEHYGKGAEKYGPIDTGDGHGMQDNWRRGYPFSLSFAALQRHAWQFWGGEDIDAETGSKHLIAAAWHCLAMAHWLNNKEVAYEFDDRPTL